MQNSGTLLARVTATIKRCTHKILATGSFLFFSILWRLMGRFLCLEAVQEGNVVSDFLRALGVPSGENWKAVSLQIWFKTYM